MSHHFYPISEIWTDLVLFLKRARKVQFKTFGPVEKVRQAPQDVCNEGEELINDASKENPEVWRPEEYWKVLKR